MACFAQTTNWNTAMFWVAIVAAVIAFASEWIRQWWNRTKISLVLELPEKVTVPSFGCVYWLGKKSTENDAIWVRMRVKNEGWLLAGFCRRLARLSRYLARLCEHVARLCQPSARSCQAFLTTIEKRNGGGKYEVVHRDMLPLHWAFKDGEKEPAIDIPGGLEAYCDVFKTEENDSCFRPRTVAQPATWQLLSQPGEYKLKVVVVGDNITHQEEFLRIRWLGVYNDFEIGSGETGSLTRVPWDGSPKRDNNVQSS